MNDKDDREGRGKRRRNWDGDRNREGWMTVEKIKQELPALLRVIHESWSKDMKEEDEKRETLCNRREKVKEVAGGVKRRMDMRRGNRGQTNPKSRLKQWKKEEESWKRKKTETKKQAMIPRRESKRRIDVVVSFCFLPPVIAVFRVRERSLIMDQEGSEECTGRRNQEEECSGRERERTRTKVKDGQNTRFR